MDKKNSNELAIQCFVEYFQIKTVQYESDFNRAFEFLKKICS